jgi:hypothetical protein
MRLDLKHRSQKGRRILALLNKQLWPDLPDPTWDCVQCGVYAGFAALFTVALLLGQRSVWLTVAVASFTALLVVAAIGLKRERHWAALLATGLFGMIGHWWVSLAFAARAQELGRMVRGEQALLLPATPAEVKKSLPATALRQANSTEVETPPSRSSGAPREPLRRK